MPDHQIITLEGSAVKAKHKPEKPPIILKAPEGSWNTWEGGFRHHYWDKDTTTSLCGQWQMMDTVKMKRTNPKDLEQCGICKTQLEKRKDG